MINMEKLKQRKELINGAREYMINAVRRDIDIIADYDINNDLDLHFINSQIDDTIKLLELLRVRFIDSKDLFKGNRND